MRILILAIVLAACARSTPAPQPPQPVQQIAAAPRNAAIDYARTLAPDAQCIPIATAQPGQPDTAICDIDQVLAYCRAGVGAGSRCAAFADLRPRPQEEPPPKAKPEPAKPKQKK